MEASAQHEGIRKVYLYVLLDSHLTQFGYLIWTRMERWICGEVTELSSDEIAQNIP